MFLVGIHLIEGRKKLGGAARVIVEGKASRKRASGDEVARLYITVYVNQNSLLSYLILVAMVDFCIVINNGFLTFQQVRPNIK